MKTTSSERKIKLKQIGNSFVRVIVVSLEEPDALERLSKMRPSPSYYVAHGDTKTITEIYKLVTYYLNMI